MTTYRITKTFTSGLLVGLTATMDVTFDGPCRFRLGQEVKGIGGGSYRVERIQVVA